MSQASTGKNLRRSPGCRSGFSLVEMMIVVLLLGIVASIATPPMVKYLQSSRLQTQADQLAADLQYARSLSIANGVVLQFASTEAGYVLRDPASGRVFKTMNFDGGPQLDMAQDTFFFPWGMADDTTFTMNGHGQSRQIRVLPTGIVEVP
jgi:type II secretion system protein H|nr:GspH/FimT family pseudopilin [Candidatus Krumholzibacteria bacterium]